MLHYSVFLIIGFVSCSLAHHLPADFPRCHRDMANLGTCLLKATETLKPRLQKGVSELGLPPLDPFRISKLTLDQGFSAINYKVDLANITINGMEDYKFKSLEYDSEKYVLSGIVTFEKLFVSANYEFDGKILMTPLKGTGVVKAFTGLTTATFVLHGEFEEQNGQNYIKPKEAEIKMDISSGGGYFDGSVNGNEKLSEVTNRVLNENAQAILKDAIPLFEVAIKEIVLDFGRKTVGQIPYDEILPLSS